MKLYTLRSLVTAQLALCTLMGASSSQAKNITDSCYYIPLPDVPTSDENRAVPWGEPTIHFANGTTCCSSIDQVGSALDEIDAQILPLLGKRYVNIQCPRRHAESFGPRSMYIREAARFRANVTDEIDPSRRQHVIQGAIDNAPAVHLPQIIAEMAYVGIWNSSVLFENCLVRD